jgi:nicotinamide mononucleotide transporter
VASISVLFPPLPFSSHLRHHLPMSSIELLAALLGLINVALIVRRSVWNYPFGIVMCALYFFVFRQAGLLSDAGLQVFFVVVNVWGWMVWLRHRDSDGAVIVEVMRWPARLGWAVATLLLCAAWGTIMARHTDASYPWWDGSIAVISVVSQILMALRRLENWVGWIIVNLISIPLYAIKALHATMGLYLVLLAMAVLGLIAWRNALAEQRGEVRT